MASPKEGSNGEDLKIFTMRNVPEELRKRWKIICLIESVTMEQFAVDAIREKIDRYSTNRLQQDATPKTEASAG